MKKHNPGHGARTSQQHNTIRDYGHDRTVHSLGRGEEVRVRRQKVRRKMVGVFAALLLTGLLAWQAWPLVFTAAPTETTIPVTEATTIQTVAPTTTIETTIPTTTETTIPTEATLSPAERQARLEEAGNEVKALLASKDGRFGIYYQNLVTGETWEYNSEAIMFAASTIKLVINTYLYTKIASGEIDMDDTLKYDNREYPTGDYAPGTGSIQYEDNGTAFTVRQTTRLSIRISDNVATNMIIRKLGGIDNINPYINSISGVVDYRVRYNYTDYAGVDQYGRSRTCAVDLGKQAANLYRLWQAKPDIYQTLIDDLSNTGFEWGIQNGIPDEIQVAHKIGTYSKYSAENDFGIVFTEEPFVLCVLTEMKSAEAGHEVMADVASIFYDYVTSMQPD